MVEQGTTDRTQQDADVVEGFRDHMTGKLEPAHIENGVVALKTATTAYSATGSFASLLFYVKLRVQVTGGKSFDGSAWGVTFPGGNALFGDVYTDDIDRLYRDTTTFAFQATPVYTAVEFFDSDGTLLGHFQAGGIGTSTGAGGGSGSWS